MTGPEGFDERVNPALEWAAATVHAEWPFVDCRLIAGGRSNLTYRLTDSGGRSWILRRPPAGPLLPRAHDVEREHLILEALSRSSRVPVPEPLGLCPDPTLLGVPFYLMADVAGLVLRRPEDADHLTRSTCSELSHHAVDVLAALHGEDFDHLGLSGLGPHSDYASRQLYRWMKQLERSTDDEVIARSRAQQEALGAAIPSADSPALVHGDYRLDNLVADPDEATISAVLDWEIATIGEPVADLAMFLVYWDEVGDERPSLGVPGPTMSGDFPSRAEMATRYSEVSGRSIADIGFYLALGYWKLSCVLQGVADRYRAGGGGGADPPPPDADEHVRWLIGRSQACLRSPDPFR